MFDLFPVFPEPLRTFGPVTVCRFSGCRMPWGRTVEWKGRYFDVCDGHGAAIEAAKKEDDMTL